VLKVSGKFASPLGEARSCGVTLLQRDSTGGVGFLHRPVRAFRSTNQMLRVVLIRVDFPNEALPARSSLHHNTIAHRRGVGGCPVASSACAAERNRKPA
jgi:hypothetical protein